MNDKIKAVLSIAEQLKSLFPKTMIGLTIYSDGKVSLWHHGPKTYHDATELFREFGIGVRSKRPMEALGGYTIVEGQSDGLSLTCFPDGLPPTCRKITVTKRVPKTQTVETGDFIEIQETHIECGEPATEDKQ